MDATLKITKSVHFVLQISPRKHGLQKKWSTPQRSQRKILRNCKPKNSWVFKNETGQYCAPLKTVFGSALSPFFDEGLGGKASCLLQILNVLVFSDQMNHIVLEAT